MMILVCLAFDTYNIIFKMIRMFSKLIIVTDWLINWWDTLFQYESSCFMLVHWILKMMALFSFTISRKLLSTVKNVALLENLWTSCVAGLFRRDLLLDLGGCGFNSFPLSACILLHFWLWDNCLQTTKTKNSDKKTRAQQVEQNFW